MYLADLNRELMKMNRICTLFLTLIIFCSCRNDDGDDVIIVPPLLLGDVVIDDDAELQEYFQTHFYNYEDFENPPANFDFKVVIDTIAGDNATKRPLLQDITSKTFLVSSDDFGLDVEETDIPHKLYFLEARAGQGEKPTIGDNTILRYEGSLLEGTVFDGANAEVSFYPPTLIRGFGAGLSEFSTGDSITEVGDGTIDFGEYGVGVLFMPSGLGYFNGFGPSGTLPQYSILVFKIDNLSFEENTDFDGDGIPSILEDLNGDGDLSNDNTDADTEEFVTLPNHADADDDGDGTLTIDEDLEPDQDLSVDRDGDGDPTNDIGDGDPTNDDTDGDGIPNYLDTDDTASREEAE